ncbi:MAG: cation:proton antiporter regulatory subunit [Bacillota bacterium]
MAEIKEAELPGLGKKYMVRLDSGERFGIVIYDEGNRELFFFGADEDEPACSVTFTDQEARQVGSIIGGAFYQPKVLEKLEAAVAELHIEWLKISPNAEVAGKSIGDLAVRKKYGITIVAVIEETEKGKKRTAAINPGPGYVFTPGQTIIVAGRRDALEKFERMVTGEGG